MLVAALVSSLLWAAVVGGPAAPAAAPEPFRLQIVHLNDFHARFEPVSKSAGSCKEGDTCQGGLARVARALLDERNRNPEALLLNAGDNFQGTLWYTLFRWNVTAHFMSRLPWDAMVGTAERRATCICSFRFRKFINFQGNGNVYHGLERSWRE